MRFFPKGPTRPKVSYIKLWLVSVLNESSGLLKSSTGIKVHSCIHSRIHSNSFKLIHSAMHEIGNKVPSIVSGFQKIF